MRAMNRRSSVSLSTDGITDAEVALQLARLDCEAATQVAEKYMRLHKLYKWTALLSSSTLISVAVAWLWQTLSRTASDNCEL